MMPRMVELHWAGERASEAVKRATLLLNPRLISARRSGSRRGETRLRRRRSLPHFRSIPEPEPELLREQEDEDSFDRYLLGRDADVDEGSDIRGDEELLIETNETTTSRWSLGWGFRSLMLERIPSNWAELCGYLVFMASFNTLFRIAVIYSKYPADQNAFTFAQAINNFAMLMHYCSTSYMLGTIALTDVCTLFYILIMTGSAILFTFFSTLSFFQTSLSPDSVPHWTTLTIAGYSSGFTLMVLCFIYQALMAKRYSKAYFFVYISTLCTVICFHTLLFIYLEDGVHIHHWYLCWVFMMFLRDRGRLSILSHAVATGIFQQGIAAYGCAPVLYNAVLT